MHIWPSANSLSRAPALVTAFHTATTCWSNNFNTAQGELSPIGYAFVFMGFNLEQATGLRRMKRLYIEGHHHVLGYIVSLEMVDASPVRYYQKHPEAVRAIVDRFNRRFAQPQSMERAQAR